MDLNLEKMINKTVSVSPDLTTLLDELSDGEAGARIAIEEYVARLRQHAANVFEEACALQSASANDALRAELARLTALPTTERDKIKQEDK